MIAASLYILVCSARNRLRVRLRRLREPRYLIGAIVGLAYLYLSVFARMRGGARAVSVRERAVRDRRAPFPADVLLASGLPGLLLLAGAALAWLVPLGTAMLDFTDAEIDFLFAAPVSRRGLLLHRLMRSQLGMLFTALVATLAFPGAWAARLRLATGMWVILVTTRVYYTGVSLARTRMLSRKGGFRGLAWLPLALIAAGTALVSASLIREFAAHPAVGPQDLLTRANQVLTSGAAGIVLWPFIAITRPLYAPWAVPFLTALLLAVGVLAATFVWVLKADEAIQEIVAQVADRRAQRLQVPATPIVRARPTGLTLAPHGRPEGAFFWKNGVQTMRAGGVALVRYLIPLVAAVATVTSFALSATRARGSAAAACLVASGVAVFTSLLGPQILRTDLRSDLQHLELLKTWPVRPASVVRGEILWPFAMLSGIVWLAIGCAAMFSAAAFPNVTAVARLSYAGAALLVAPALVLAQYLVQNAAAVLFPAWIPQGDQRPRGVDAMGQRLIMLGGVMLSVTILFTPGAIAGAFVWLAFGRLLGPLVLLPAAALCTAIVAVEVAAVTEALGPVYERLDVLAVERAE